MRLILISGKKRSGKNTVADMLRDSLGHKHVSNVAIAQSLKDLCFQAFTPLTDRLNEEWELANKKGETGYFNQFVVRKDTWYERKNVITRMIEQITGTEIVRVVDSDFWVKQTILSIRELHKKQYVTVSDWRFPNEYAKLDDAFPNAFRLRIERNTDNFSSNNDGTEEHISETALDFAEFDYTIKNEGSVEDLKIKVDFLVDKLLEEGME